MKKILIIFAFLIVLLIGVGLGNDNNLSKAKYIQDETEEFENEIAKPDNIYQPRNQTSGGINNRLAKVGGNIISNIFDFSFGLLDDLIG